MYAAIFLLVGILLFLTGCSSNLTLSSSDKQSVQQEQNLSEGVSQVGVPSITHFREMRLLKTIYELRDQEGLVTYSYLYNEMQGKLIFLCTSIGYGIPYSTQFTSSEAMKRWSLPATKDRIIAYGTDKLPQAEPNGLYPPTSADGTWILCLDPTSKLKVNGSKVLPMYVEPKVTVSPFRIPPGLAVYP